MRLAGLSDLQIQAALLENDFTQASIASTLATSSNTLAKTANAVATKTQAEAEEDELAARWLALAGEEAETISTTTNTGAKLANTTATNLLTVAWSKLNAVMMAHPLIALTAAAFTLGGAVIALGKALGGTVVSMEEAQEATADAVEAYNNITSEIENLKTNLSNLQSQIDGLDPLTDKEDIANLQAESEELERQLAILEEKRRVAGLEADKAAQESLGKTIESKYEGSETFDLGTLKNKFVGDKVTEQEELQNAMDAYDEYAEHKAQKEAELAEMAKSGDYTQEEWDAAEQAIADYDQKMQDARLHANELATSLNEQKQGLNGNTAESRKLINETDTQIDKYTKWTEKINEATGALDKNTESKNNNSQPQSIASSRSAMISDLNDMSEGFESLDKLYASVKDSDPFDFKLLDDKNFKETFSGLGDVYEDFVEQITSTPDDIEACQGAFDDLLTEWVHSTGILSNVTEENAKLTESMLTQMGVANAEEVVMKQLAAQKAYAAETSQDLANATAEDIMNFYNESTAADETKNQIYAYYLEKQLAAGLALDTSADVNALYNLVSALGGATSALKIYYGMLNGGAGLNAADVSGMHGGDGKYAKQMAQNQAKAEIEKIQANMKANTNVKFSGGTKSKGTSGSGGGRGSKSTAKLFDWIERRIQKFQTKFDRWIKEAETAVTSGFVTKYYNRAATAEKNLMNTQGSAYTYYMKKANKVGLSNKYEKKVKNGKISIENVKSEKTQTKIDNYQSYYDKAQQALDAFRESAEKFYNIPLEKSAKKIELLSEAIELLDAKLENADGYTTQNNILETQINKQKQILNASNSAETETGKKLTSAGKTLKKSANLKGLSKDNKKTVKDAIKASEEIDISLFKEGSKGYQAAVKYNEALKANKKAIYDADLAQEEYTSTLHENRMQQLENIKAEYDSKDAILDASTSRLQAMNDLKESRGEYLSASDYEGLLGNASANILNQEEELKEYVERFNQNRADMSAEDIADAEAYIEEMKAGITEAKQEQQELNNAVANLPYEKYERQLELLDAIAEKRKSEVDLAEAQGKDLLESDYIDQINNNLTEIKLLEAERNQAYNDYMNAMRNGGAYGGKSAEEWQKEYLGLDAEINGVKADNEALKDSLRDDVYWRDFERAHKVCEDLQSILEGMDGLISEEMMFDTDTGKFTELGVSHIANLVKQYENARDEVQNYTNDIQNLDKLYKEGQYTEQEYKEKLVELQGGLFDSADAMKSYINSVKELYKQQEQAELDNLFEIIDARNEALQKKKEYYDYDKNLRNQTKELQILEAERAALEGINTAEAKAKKAQLDAEIAEQKEALDETVEQHLMDISTEALDSLKETMQDAFDDRWASMDSNMQAMVGLMQTANELATQNAADIKNAMFELLKYYGIDASKTELTSVTGYAGGTKKVPRDMIAMINESGAEMVVTKHGLLTPLSQGDGVIPADMTENLMRMATTGNIGTPEIVTPQIQMPNVESGNVLIVEGNLLNIEGHTTAVTKDDLNDYSKKLENTLVEKSYKYTSNKMYSGYLKTGGKRRI